MKSVERVHASYVGGRRVRVLAGHLCRLLPRDARVLDVGSGDTHVAHRLSQLRSDLVCEGIDVLVRTDTLIPVRQFDGRSIPFADDSFDAVLLIDVVHHAEDGAALLREAHRVARQCIVLKDHTLEGPLAGPTLRFMDRVGNERHDVTLPYNYWRRREWAAEFDRQQLEIEEYCDSLGLYPWPASWIFGRSLHFIARLGVCGARGAPTSKQEV